MRSVSTPRRPAEARREQLLDAAKAVVAEHGFHGVSIEAVARGAGVTRPIVYRHFDDLAALLDALVERETLRALLQLRGGLPAGVDDLLAAFGGYPGAGRSDPGAWGPGPRSSPRASTTCWPRSRATSRRCAAIR